MRKAQAVGLVRDIPDDTELTLGSVKRVVARIRKPKRFYKRYWSHAGFVEEFAETTPQGEIAIPLVPSCPDTSEWLHLRSIATYIMEDIIIPLRLLYDVHCCEHKDVITVLNKRTAA